MRQNCYDAVNEDACRLGFQLQDGKEGSFSGAGLSEVAGPRAALFEEDCVVGTKQAETSLLIVALRLLVLLIDEKQNGFGVGQQITR